MSFMVVSSERRQDLGNRVDEVFQFVYPKRQRILAQTFDQTIRTAIAFPELNVNEYRLLVLVFA